MAERRPAWQRAVATFAASASAPTGGVPRWAVLAGPAGSGKRPFAERVLAALARSRRARVVAWTGSEWRAADPGRPEAAFAPSPFRADPADPDAPFDHMVAQSCVSAAEPVLFYVPRLGTLPPQFQASLVESMSDEMVPSDVRGVSRSDARRLRGLIVADESACNDRSEADPALVSRCALARAPARDGDDKDDDEPEALGRAGVGRRCAECCRAARVADTRTAVASLVEDVTTALAREPCDGASSAARALARVSTAICTVAIETATSSEGPEVADLYAAAVARAVFAA